MAQQAYTTHGIIHEIQPEEERGGFKKKKLILRVEGYEARSEFGEFEFFGKNAEKLDKFRKGDRVEIEWNLKGRDPNGGRCWTTLSAWKITGQGGQPGQGGGNLRETFDYAERTQEPRRSRPPQDMDDINF